MASVGEHSPPYRGASLWGKTSRGQYAALTAMRWQAFRHSVRTMHGAAELGARIALGAVYSVMGLGMALGLGAGGYAAVHKNNWGILSFVLWALFLVWQIVPVTMASFQEQYDLSGLLRFPVTFSAYYLLHVIFGLVDASSIVGGLGCAGIWVGILIAEPSLAAPAALALGLFALFNILLVRAIFAWIDRWLAQRRTREIISSAFFIALIGLQFLNPGLRRQATGRSMTPQEQREAHHWLERADRVQQWLPPGLAASTVQSASMRAWSGAIEECATLGLFALATGGVLSLRLRAQYRGENLGEAPSRKKAERHSGQWFLDGSGPIAAVMEKELRTLMRALPLLYALGAPLLMVFIFSSMFTRGNASFHNLPIGLLLCTAYTTLGFTQMFYNNLGTEGSGIQMLLLAPTPLRTVILAKNLFYTALYAVDVVMVFALAAGRFGLPGPMDIAAVLAWLAFSVPVYLATGNLFSLLMPYRMNLGRIGRQRGAQANGLLALLIQLGVLGVGAAVFALSVSLQRIWLVFPLFLLLGAGAVLAWVRGLGRVDQIALARRDRLIATLVKTE